MSSPPAPSGLPSGEARVIPPAGVSVILGVVVTYAGHVVNDQPVTERVVIGGSFLIVCLTVAHVVSPGFADVFALLILVALVLRYGVAILQSIGLATSGD